jgi:type I restriction enzyme S subunit
VNSFPEGWSLATLDELAIVRDGSHVTPTYLTVGIPFLRVTDIQDEEIDLVTVKRISPEEHANFTRSIKPQKGDILYSKNGTIGIPRLVTWDWDFSIFVSFVVRRKNWKTQ